MAPPPPQRPQRAGSRASSASTGTAPQPQPSAQVVGNAFAMQYYNILHQSPEKVHMFYRDGSRLTRPSAAGTGVDTVTTTKAINEAIMATDAATWTSIEVESVVAHDSRDGGVIVLVTGSHAAPNCRRRRFSQTFYLAPQDVGGYFVRDDTLSYIDDGAGPAPSAATQASATGPARGSVSDGEMIWPV